MSYKFYLTGQLANIELLKALAIRIEKAFNGNMRCSSRWLEASGIMSAKESAICCLSDVDVSQLLIVTYPYGRGVASEVGFAFGKGIPIIHYLPSILELPAPEECVVNPNLYAALPIGLFEEFTGDFSVNCPGYIVRTWDALYNCISMYFKPYAALLENKKNSMSENFKKNFGPQETNAKEKDES